MSTAAAVSATVSIPLVKQIVDDLYNSVKNAAANKWHFRRADLNESSITKALIASTKTKTLLHYKSPVSLYEFYYPTRIDFSTGKTSEVNSVKKFDGGNIVIEGTAGQGKSLFLKYLCGQELNAKYCSGKIPFLVELRRLRSDYELIDLLLEALGRYKLPQSKSFWDYLATSGKIILLLDAFDEIDQGQVGRALNDIERFAESYDRKLQIIVTSRPQSDICYSPHFHTVKLSQLSPVDHHPFLDRLCKDKSQSSSLAKIIENSSTDIKNLLVTPLMMALLVLLYQSLQAVPDTLPKFYEELFDVLFYRHDQFKPGFRRRRFTSLDDSKVKTIFAALCFFVRINNLNSMSATAFNQCVEDACKVTNQTVDPLRFRDEMTKTVCLVLEDGLEFSFIHKSITQYYAASFVRTSADDFASGFYKATLSDAMSEQWALELRFLKEIDVYRYMKWREIPLLLRAASLIKYTFDDPSREAEGRLRDHLYSLLEFRVHTTLHSLGINEDNQERRNLVIAISKPRSSDALVLALGEFIFDELLRAAASPPFKHDLVAYVETVYGKNYPNCLDISLASVSDMLTSSLPSLCRDGLARLRDRYVFANRAIVAEEGKKGLLNIIKNTKNRQYPNESYPLF
jgi:hypothetical protein